jgi:LytS/YehU family sensor histidine kinase
MALIQWRWPVERVGRVRHVTYTLSALLGFTLLRRALGGRIERWILGPRLEFHGSETAVVIGDVIIIGCAIAVALAVDLHRKLKHREAEASKLEARLAEARLQALSQQIHPHFLFNTLNMISVLVHRDPKAADTMLNRLADLLRETLRRPAAQEVALREELAWLEHYLDIMRVRFGPRLSIETIVPPHLADCRVPSFILQPLVENALEHGIARRSGPGRVRIEARTEGSRLRIEILDDGPGPPVQAEDLADGIGLTNTRRRLEQLYGANQRLTLDSAPGGGGRTVFEIPIGGTVLSHAPA